VPFYFVTFNTHGRRKLLDTAELHSAFLDFSHRAYKEYDVEVGCYIIMPDHIHLFVRIPLEGITLKKWIQTLKAVLGKTLLSQNVEKPHWQEGFFDHLLRTPSSYGEKWHYVQQNAVRAGLCAHEKDWPYQGEICRLSF